MRCVSTLITEFPDIKANPITLEELEEPLASLKRSDKIGTIIHLIFIALGVSGGGDSLAMTHLVKKWASLHHPTLALQVFVVDHKLRSESTEEAKYVSNFVETVFKIPSKILTVHWDKPPKQKQLEARTKRHQILYEACKRNGITLLVLAHHVDDMIETLFYRIAFQTGVLGLATISSLRQEHNDYWIMRPFLNFTKERMLSTLIHQDIKWIEDPTNREESDFRGIIRRDLNVLYEQGINKEEILHLIHHFKKHREFISKYLESFFVNHVKYDLNFAMARVPLYHLRRLPDEVVAKVMFVIISFLRNKEDNKEEKILEAARKIRSIKQGSRVTVCGCFFWRDQESLYVCREIQESDPLEIEYGSKYIWDDRFEIEVEQYDKWKYSTKKEIANHLRQLESNYFQLLGNNFNALLYPSTRIAGYNGRVDTNPYSKLMIRVLTRKELVEFMQHREQKSLLQNVQEPVRTSMFAIFDEEGLLAIPQIGFKKKANVFVDFKFLQKTDIAITLNRY